MRLSFLAFFTLLMSITLGGKFVGTLTVHPDKPFVLKNVRANVVAGKSANTASIILHDVKFSPFMPVRLTITIPDIVVSPIENGYQFSGSNIVPIKGGKPYASRKVSELRGRQIGNTISLSLTIGTAPIRYQGRVVER